MVKPPIDIDMGCYAILPEQQVGTVAARQLPEHILTHVNSLVNRRFLPFIWVTLCKLLLVSSIPFDGGESSLSSLCGPDPPAPSAHEVVHVLGLPHHLLGAPHNLVVLHVLVRV